LRFRDPCDGRENGRTRGEMQKLTTGKFHDASSREPFAGTAKRPGAFDQQCRMP